MKTLRTAGSNVPTPADEVDIILMPVDGTNSVRAVAAGRLTGPYVFIKVRLPGERGE